MAMARERTGAPGDARGLGGYDLSNNSRVGAGRRSSKAAARQHAGNNKEATAQNTKVAVVQGAAEQRQGRGWLRHGMRWHAVCVVVDGGEGGDKAGASPRAVGSRQRLSRRRRRRRRRGDEVQAGEEEEADGEDERRGPGGGVRGRSRRRGR